MKGSIFIALNEMVIEQHGLASWLNIIDAANSDGVFVATENYPDEQILALVSAYCDLFKLPADKVLVHFGHYLFGALHQNFPRFANSHKNFFDFIASIDGVIHVEVHKLDEHAITPDIKVQQVSATEAQLSYQSARKLCHLAEGLLHGAAEHFEIALDISQSSCMHDGADACQFHLRASELSGLSSIDSSQAQTQAQNQYKSKA